MLLIYGQSFSSLENGPGWAVTFQSGKWSKILMDSHFPGKMVRFSSSENGPRFLMTVIFQFGKWSKMDSHHGSDRLLMYHRQ
jgi:hypothetical protein